ncbi:aromatic amino acid DMT transporter YddG [Pseudoalteromonas sp. McH1-7]|uniref:aromatic amino acid DMT transporter YddG n=1 Tax=unclassified Pseudoalteromonas TaxID=194690 RepID=UPI00158FC986|nr:MULTISPECIES: aromatic amino acid DMT transporter YddG [unclassified Pseudoalteromonas]NUZ11140.1 aromatic amino acid DMT transporter YddG [Pseudoalteromonas sp. McH1-7]USD30386.1 aromatic amino acid DMT transporter YddG [Pseudoalteromonas sp. SCSIO 43201]
MQAQYKFTVFGILAVLVWSAVLHVMRIVSEDFGAIGGATLIYSVAAIFLVLFLGFPKMKSYPKSYVIFGGVLFVAYELCLSLSLGFANSRTQSAQVLIVNYLWPLFTILGAIISRSNSANTVLLFCGSILAFTGVYMVVSGDTSLSIESLVSSIVSNPMAFGLAFGGAIIWAVYCNLTKMLSNGQNAITLFFIFTAITLWVKWCLIEQSLQSNFSFYKVCLLVVAGGGMALGYALWNKAIIGGNMILLAVISYFTPVFSGIFASWILDISLTTGFWVGVIAVTLGSLLCWQSTRTSVNNNNVAVSDA